MMVNRVVASLIAGRWWLFAFALVLWGAAWFPSRHLTFDRRIEQMFPAADPAVEAYDLLRRRFGGNAVAMLVYHDRNLMSRDGLAQVGRLAAEAAEVPGIEGVLSLAQVDEALSAAEPGRLLGFADEPAILGDAPLAEGFRELFAGYTHDASYQYAAIVAMLDPARPDEHAGAIAALRSMAAELPAKNRPHALVGEPVLIAEGFSLIEADGHRLSTTTLWLLAATTLLMFRSLRWVLAQWVLIFWAVTLTRGAAVLLGLQLSMVSSMLTAIVTVIAVASVIHVAVQFGLRRRRGDDPVRAAERTLRRVLPPILWACLTDAAGFAALSISRVGPVRDFGLLMTLGSGMVLVGVVLVLPAVILMPPHRFASAAVPGDRFISRSLVRLVRWLGRHRGAVGAISLAVAVLAGVGLTRLRTETNFIRNFRASSPLARSYAMVENHLGGAGVWDVILPAPEVLSPAYLESVRQLEKRLRGIRVPGEAGGEAGGEQVRLSKVLSMADADAKAAEAPLMRLATPGVRIAGMRAAMPTFVDALLTPAGAPGSHYARIMLRSPERLEAAPKMALIDAVNGAVDRHTSTAAWRELIGSEQAPQGLVTGYYVLLARLIEGLLSDQWICLGVAAAAVFLMIAVAFRSLRLAAVCMIPNLLPVLAVLGALGLSGIKVNMGAAMIAAVSIGLTIDGSIHFLALCRAAQRRGASPLRAVLYAQSGVGLPVLLATIALALGFSVLASSTFIPTVTFGLLVTAALAAGTAANLTLLPLLLVETLPRPNGGRWRSSAA